MLLSVTASSHHLTKKEDDVYHEGQERLAEDHQDDEGNAEQATKYLSTDPRPT